MLQAAIISLGLIGAGTNNARIAGMLRNLSSYYYKDASLLFCVWAQSDCLNNSPFFSRRNASIYIIDSKMQVRIAQGLVHLGKGLLTLSPYHSERALLSP